MESVGIGHKSMGVGQKLVGIGQNQRALAKNQWALAKNQRDLSKRASLAQGVIRCVKLSFRASELEAIRFTPIIRVSSCAETRTDPKVPKIFHCPPLSNYASCKKTTESIRGWDLGKISGHWPKSVGIGQNQWALAKINGHA